MKHINKWIYPALLALSCSAHAQTTLIKNVNGYSINNGQLSTFDAIEIKDDKISRLYNKQQPRINTDMRIIDADGKTMLPGLIDAHGHVLGWGLNLMRTNLRGSLSEAEAVKRTREFRQQNPELAWVQGRGWNQVLWPSKTFPTAAFNTVS